eukprot:CAMPEP_0115755898 /NCGR_PEP_ID=MMETSP0272-20121206/97631_1 /TAXON_ID=71861 /ORGANISM="Scrippsiella trochoidea, Strain CCMP3099" /LENGTH=95 /DNA_ID=CAMNT_0003201367 /DNA_START=11 /DNA_END=298 /DNA_ORIENTATION=+
MSTPSTRTMSGTAARPASVSIWQALSNNSSPRRRRCCALEAALGRNTAAAGPPAPRKEETGQHCFARATKSSASCLLSVCGKINPSTPSCNARLR